MSGMELIHSERERQLTEEGWTSEHDNEWVNGELAQAAYCYIALPVPVDLPDDLIETGAYSLDPPPGWPWHKNWWKPKDRKRNLIRAGALLMAEQHRLGRKIIQIADELDYLDEIQAR